MTEVFTNQHYEFHFSLIVFHFSLIVFQFVFFISVKQYHVRIQDNDFTRSQLNLHGPYVLCLDSLKLTLVHPEKGNMLYAWPYKYLRRYGRDKTSFSMEAGRKCQSGPGLIVFETSEGNNIFHEIQNFVNSLSVSQPLGPKVKKEQATHGSHEDLSSRVKQLSTVDNDALEHKRSHSLSSSQPVTQTKEFKDKIAERRQQRYTDQALVGKPSKSNPSKPVPYGAPPEPQIYSEVSDEKAMDQPRMPEPYDGEYDIAGDMGPTHKGPPIHHGPPPPDSDEYDELSGLYTNPKERQNGDAWKKYALPSDNIHTEIYDGQPLHTRKPPVVGQKTKTKNKVESPKVNRRHDQRKPAPQPEESMYSIATSPSPPTSVSPPRVLQTGEEVYDHLDRHEKVPKPKPVPRRPNPQVNTARKPPPSKPVPRSPIQHIEAPIYDHLERQNKGKPVSTPKPKPSVRKPKLDPNSTYGHLFQEIQEPEETYGHLHEQQLPGDKGGYLTSTEIAPYQDVCNEEAYDELGNVVDRKQYNEDSLYDMPET